MWSHMGLRRDLPDHYPQLVVHYWGDRLLLGAPPVGAHHSLSRYLGPLLVSKRFDGIEA